MLLYGNLSFIYLAYIKTPIISLRRNDSNMEACQDCGNQYETVYWVNDSLWRLISPKPESPGAGLLCIPCADRRARAEGIHLQWSVTESALGRPY